MGDRHCGQTGMELPSRWRSQRASSARRTASAKRTSHRAHRQSASQGLRRRRLFMRARSTPRRPIHPRPVDRRGRGASLLWECRSPQRQPARLAVALRYQPPRRDAHCPAFAWSTARKPIATLRREPRAQEVIQGRLRSPWLDAYYYPDRFVNQNRCIARYYNADR